MSTDYLLAIDIGTGSGRAVLFSPDGRQVATGQREYSPAICAGVGAGIWKSTAEGASSVASFERTVEPEPNAAAAYRELYENWLEIYRYSMPLAESDLVRPLWRAAGT